MGSAAPISHHVPMRFLLGLFDEDEIVKLTRNCEVLLVPPEVPRRVRHDDEWAFCELAYDKLPESFNVDGSPYRWSRSARLWISTRKTRGYPWLPNSETSRVYIHATNGVESVRLDSLEAGEESAVVPGLRVKYKEQSKEVVFALVQWEGDNTPLKVLHDNADMWPPQPGVRPQPGVYYSPDMRGQGIDLQATKAGPVLFWYTFDDDENLDWFVSDPFAVGDTEARLYTKSGLGGEPHYVGSVRLLTHQGRTYMDWDTEPHGRGSVELTRLTDSQEGISGIWYNPERDGEGFTFRQIGDRVVGWFYTFDGGARQWYYLDGAGEDLTVYKAEGAFIRHNVGARFLTREGKATLQEEGDAMAFYWNDFQTRLVRL
jgi:hypothetical protein